MVEESFSPDDWLMSVLTLPSGRRMLIALNPKIYQGFGPHGTLENIEQAISMLRPHPDVECNLQSAIMRVVSIYWGAHMEMAEAPAVADVRSEIRALKKQARAVRQSLPRWSIRGYGSRLELADYVIGAVIQGAIKNSRERDGDFWRLAVQGDVLDTIDRCDKALADLDVLLIEASKPRPAGRGNAWERFYANPKALLALSCGSITYRVLPEILSGTLGGDFHQFVSIVYEFATGEDPDSPGVGLDDYVKHYGPALRRKWHLETDHAAGKIDDATLTKMQQEIETVLVQRGQYDGFIKLDKSRDGPDLERNI